MLFATVNGEKLAAEPGITRICPLCEQSLIPKCGEINVRHWAHQKEEGCDSWYDPETEWHKSWKLIFGKDNCEVVMSRDGVRHIADILTTEIDIVSYIDYFFRKITRTTLHYSVTISCLFRP